MARQPALKVLQSTPTHPAQAGPENRLCIKCGLWDDKQHTVSIDDSYGAGILFVGYLEDKDREFMLKICKRNGWERNQVGFINPTLCSSNNDPTPLSVRCCRPFILGNIRTTRSTHVVALGSSGLASLTGNCAKTVPPHLGRQIDIPELPEVVAYATFHPEDQRKKKYPFVDPIQRGIRLVEDIKKLKEEEIPLPHESKEVECVTGDYSGIDTEFDDSQVWTVAIGNGKEYVCHDVEDDTLQGCSLPQLMVAHYVQAEIDSFVRLGICKEEWLQGKDIKDTFVLAKMQNENLPQKDYYGLEDVLTRLYRAPNWKAQTDVVDPARPGTWGLEKRKKRCGYDAWASYMIYQHPKIQSIVKSVPFVVEWTHRMIPTYHRMKYVGVMVDRDRFDRLHDITQATEIEYSARLQPWVRKEYNWPEFELSNNNHLSVLLYDRMGLPVLKRTKSGAPSTDSEALDDLIAEPFVQDLLPWRKANKLMTTWYGKEAKGNSVPLYQRIQWQDDGLGFLPVNLGVGQTSTLRRNSNAPNMQNWAKNTRQIITTRFKDKGSLVWADYEKLEVFVLANVIGCDKLLSYFLDRGGYIGIARDLMGANVQKDDSNYRATKSVVLGANYNSSAFVVANSLYYKAGVRYSDDFPEKRFKSHHYEQCRRILDDYFNMFPEIPAYFDRTKKELVKYQGVFNRFGQFRHLPCPYGEETPGFKHLWNTAINFKIQSIAGFITGISAVLIEERFLANSRFDDYNMYHKYVIDACTNLTSEDRHKYKHKTVWAEEPYLCNEVHDELMVDTPTSHLQETCDIMRQVMTKDTKEVIKQTFPDFDVHLAVELNHGSHWHVKENN